MNEKETLLKNMEDCASVVNQMLQIENECDKLEVKLGIGKEKHMSCLGLIGIIMLFGWEAFVFIYFTYETSGLFEKFIIMLLGIVPLVPFVLKFLKKKQRKERLAELEKQHSALENDPSLSWCPKDYRTGSCISALNEYIRNGRADTLKEALNLLETELHSQRMEAAAAVGAYMGAISQR